MFLNISFQFIFFCNDLFCNSFYFALVMHFSNYIFQLFNYYGINMFLFYVHLRALRLRFNIWTDDSIFLNNNKETPIVSLC